MDGQCQSGMRCVEGFCVHGESSAHCGEDSDNAGGGGMGGGAPLEPESGGSSSGRMGAPPTPISAGGIAGLSGGAGASSSENGGTSSGGGGGSPSEDAGASGDGGCEATDDFRVKLEEPVEPSCIDDVTRIPLSASGGLAPFTWSVDGASELMLEGGDGSQVTLVGAPSMLGEQTFHVRVKDACAREATLDVVLDVVGRPELVKQPLPRACAERLYRGGISTEHPGAQSTWSARNLPEGLWVDAGTGALAGAPAQAGEFEFELTLENDCGSATETFALTVDSSGTCAVGSGAFRSTRPAACRTSPYRARLSTTEAKKATDWIALALPDGLALSVNDARSASITGNPTSAGDVLVAVAIDGEYTVVGYPLGVRDTCWLGYVSAADDQLHFLDPILHSEFDTDHVVSHQDPVLDFEFSPDGGHALYLAGPSASRALFLLDVLTGGEERLPFPGGVTHYAWSAAGALAVAFREGDTDYLGGARLGSDSNLELLEPVAADVDSDIEWLGSDAVTFARSTAAGTRVAFATLGAAGFSEPRLSATVYDSPVRRLAATGVFALDFGSSKLDFLAPSHTPLGNPLVFPHRVQELVEPSGAFTGRERAGAFDVFAATMDTWDGTATPELRVSGCTKVLAWQSPRLACANDLPSPAGSGELRVFDLSAPGIPSEVVPGAEYSVSAWNGIRRGFSASGDWFAYLADGAMHFTRLDGITAEPLQSIPDAEGALDFEFSPDDKVLSVQYGSNWLELYSLSTLSSVDFEGLVAPACDEEFARAPGLWCGRAKSSSGFVWASNQTTFAFLDASKRLAVFNVTQLASGEAHVWTPVEAKDFAFQPDRTSH